MLIDEKVKKNAKKFMTYFDELEASVPEIAEEAAEV